MRHLYLSKSTQPISKRPVLAARALSVVKERPTSLNYGGRQQTPEQKSRADEAARGLKATLRSYWLRVMHSSPIPLRNGAGASLVSFPTTRSGFGARALRRIRSWVVMCACIGVSHAAHAERDHTVEPGQTLARIASRYGVSVSSLAAANGVALSAALRPGQVLTVPDPGVVYVAPGETLGGIARRYDLSPAALAQQNQLGPTAALRVGQRLILPGHERAREQAVAAHRWGAPKRRGAVALYRVATEERRRFRLIDDRGRVRRPALRELSRFLRPRTSRVGKEPHPRLIRLLAQVSDHFGGREVHVISGYRKPGGYTKDTSRHVAGQAIDFRIPGIPLTDLRDYCEKIDHVGVGYYPRSQFVHLDVRRTAARWTDFSGPGEAPLIARKGQPLPIPGEPAASDEPASADDGQPPIDEEPGAVSDH
jgi:uncharacterized protein YcbK (DUF882 family)